VTVALRPEKIVLGPAAPGGENRLAGRVRAMAYRGEASTYEVELETGKVLRVTLANTERGSMATAHEGAAVSLAFARAAGVVLEA
jgi:putrescine transport system ATP-binding protein